MVAFVTAGSRPQWSKRTEELVGWYVYALRDPRTKSVFYIGKGRNSRAFQHARVALDAGEEATPKLELIREIQKDTGADPEIFIVRHQLASEAAAYEVEAALLDYSGLLGAAASNGVPSVALTNISGGNHSKAVGIMSHDAVESLYGAKPLDRADFTLPAIAFRIPRLWTPMMTVAELYEATHGWWRLGVRRERAAFALSVSRGVIRGIFTIDASTWRIRTKGDRGWEPDEKPRWGFDGLDVSGDHAHFLHRDISAWFTMGSQTPFTYVNC